MNGQPSRRGGLGHIAILVLVAALVATACGATPKPGATAPPAGVTPAGTTSPAPEPTPRATVPPEPPPTVSDEAQPVEVAPSPADTIEAYRLAYNIGDADGMMALFTVDSILVDHPAALWGGVGDGGNTLTGLAQIREANVSDRTNAASSDSYQFSNVRVEGDLVTWDHTWVGANLVEWCGRGHRAVVADGAFVSWTYAHLPSPCSAECSPQDVFGSEPAPEECRRQEPS